MKIVSKHPLLTGTALLIFASGALYGCKDFLTEASAPQGTLNEQTLANSAGVEGSLIGAYRTLDCTNDTSANWGCAASNWVWGNVAADDAYKGSDGTDQPPINDIEGYHWGTADAETYLNEKWRIVYEGVVRSNSTIRLLKQVVAAKPGEISADNAKGIEGEALFLRAYYHFEAYRMWGNIPYYTETDTDFRKANGTAADALYEHHQGSRCSDRAASGHSKKRKCRTRDTMDGHGLQGPRSDVRRPVRCRAGNVEFRQKQRRVRPGDELRQGVDGLHDQNGKETIFAYQASVNDGEPNGNNANFGERLNFPYSGSHFGCCGFHQPSQNLVNFFKVDANGLPLATSAPNTWNVSNANFSAAIKDPVDPRLDWTVGRDGVPYKDWGLYSTADGWVRDIANGGPYGPKKNAHEKASGAESSVGWQNTQLNAVNIHLFRYADLLLLNAEAMVETGDLNGALAIVNSIRTRAAQRAQGPGTATATSR